MKQKKLVIGIVSAILCIGIVGGGIAGMKYYQKHKMETQTQKIVSEVGEDQVNGNISMLASFLKSADVGVSEAKAEDKATKLMNFMYQADDAIADIDGISLGKKENTMYISTGVNMLYVVTYEGKGDNISFKSVKEGSQGDYIAAGMMENSTETSTESNSESNTEEAFDENANAANSNETDVSTENVESTEFVSE